MQYNPARALTAQKKVDSAALTIIAGKTWTNASLNTYILHVKRNHGINLRDKQMTSHARMQYLPR